MSDGEETPYALAERLTREGKPDSEIEAALKARGLSADEVFTVLGAVASKAGRQAPLVAMDDGAADGSPSAISIDELKRNDERVSSMNLITGGGLLAIGVLLFIATHGRLLAYGAMLAGVARLAASFAKPKRLPPQVPLPAEDTSQRCAQHPEFKSIGTCPRCGSFSCRDCAPDGGFTRDRVCRKCEREPGRREERVRAAARRVSFGLLTVPLAPAALMALGARGWSALQGQSFGAASTRAPLALCLALMLGPFVVLGIAQRALRHPWPALVGLVAVVGWFLALMDITDGELDVSMAALGVPAIAVAFLATSLWGRYSEAKA